MSDEEESNNGDWSSMPIESPDDFDDFLSRANLETGPIDWDSTMKTITDSIERVNGTPFVFVYQTTVMLVRKRAPIKFLQQFLRQLPSNTPPAVDQDGDYADLIRDACTGASTDAEMIHFLLDRLREYDHDPLGEIDFAYVNLATLQIIAQHPHTSFRLRHAHDILDDFASHQSQSLRKIEFILVNAVDKSYDASPCMLHRFIGNFCSGDSRKWPGYFLRNLENLFTSILEHYPNDVRVPDADGNLPLTLVCERMTGWYMDPNLGGDKETESAKIVRLLLEAYPEAALVPNNAGKVAIHLAIENGLAATDILVEKAPACLEIPCLTGGLYPAQLAAIDWPLHKPDSAILETIYNLIRRSPMVVAHGRTSSGNATSLLDDPDYKLLCLREMQYAGLQRRHKRDLECLQRKQKDKEDAELEQCKRLRTKWNNKTE